MRFEALVKVGDNLNDALSPEEREARLYKHGDIVVVRHEGWQWGRREVKEFLIVPLQGVETEAQAQELENQVAVIYTEQRQDGLISFSVEQEDIQRRRRYTVDVDGIARDITLDGVISPNPGRLLTEAEVLGAIRDRNREFQPMKDLGKRLPLSQVYDETRKPTLAARINRRRQKRRQEGYQVQSDKPGLPGTS